MKTAAIRWVVIVTCVGGIGGMIVTSATDHNGAALTFGLVTAVAVLCQMAVTTVLNEVRGAPGAPVTGAAPRTLDDEAAAIEEQVQALVTAGVDESAVRDLVRHAVRLGRSAPSIPTE